MMLVLFLSHFVTFARDLDTKQAPQNSGTDLNPNRLVFQCKLFLEEHFEKKVILIKKVAVDNIKLYIFHQANVQI